MGVKRFVWDEVSDNVLLETDETDTVTARYCQRPERFGELLFQDRSGTKSFYHYDGNSSTCNLTNSSEAVTDTMLYTAYGEEVSSSGSTPNPFGYKGAVGYYTNESTGDIYVRNRSYEPAIGRWLSIDPFGFMDGTSLYRAYFVPTHLDALGQLVLDDDPTAPGGDLFPGCMFCGESSLSTPIQDKELPDGWQDWKCKPPRNTPRHQLDGGKYYEDFPLPFFVGGFTPCCCFAGGVVRLIARRCFHPDWYDEHGSDQKLAKHFFTEISILYDLDDITVGGCDLPEVTKGQVVVCRVFPGRYISLIGPYFDSDKWKWPDTFCDVAPAACKAVIDHPPGVTG